MSRAIELAPRSEVDELAARNGLRAEVQGHVILTHVDGVAFFAVLDEGGVASDA